MQQSIIQKAQTVLKEAGLKITETRCLIIGILMQTQEHLTAEQLHQAIETSSPNISLSSVYRNLVQFEYHNIILKHQFQESIVYEFNHGEHHDHLICIKCKKVEEFQDPAIAKRQAALAIKYNFILRYPSLNMYGICKDCKT